jgi:phosphoglycolate phosphatase-like HAD superfamily hydrolase
MKSQHNNIQSEINSDLELNFHPERLKTIIFDFDGVIVNSKKNVTDQLKSILTKMSFQMGTEMIGDQELDFIVASSIRHIPSKLNFTLWQKLYFTYQVIINSRKMYFDSKPFEGVFNVLEELKHSYDLQLCTNNISWIVLNWLNRYNAKKYFSTIHTALRSEKKGLIIQKILNKNNLNEDEVLFITDTLHDYYLVREYTQVPVGFVTSGFDSSEKLSIMQGHAQYFSSLTELLKLKK